MSGNYYRPTPLDFALLERMPDKGIIGGVHWAGRRVKHLVEDINDGVEPQHAVKTSEVQARMRAMKVAGYVVPFTAVGGRIWARTPEGAEHLKTKAEVLGA
jgi:hypothetical protein